MAEEVVEKVTTVSHSHEANSEPVQKTYTKKKAIFRTYQIIWYILAVVEILLAFRMVLKAIGANPLSEFVNLIYGLSNVFAMPFNNIIANTIVGNSVFEWSTIIAAVVYAVIAYGLVYLMQIVKPVTPREVEQKVENP